MDPSKGPEIESEIKGKPGQEICEYQSTEKKIASKIKSKEWILV
jgi:hypothetical protein